MAAERGIAVVFAAMPMNRSSLDRLDPRYAAGWDRHLARLAAGHPEVVWRSKLWSLPDDHFGDGSHVNLRGARAGAWPPTCATPPESPGNHPPLRCKLRAR